MSEKSILYAGAKTNITTEKIPVTIPTSYYRTIRRNPYLVSYLRLNDTSGTRAVDWGAKYGLNGIYGDPSLGHSALILNDEVARSAQFGSSSQYVEIPDAVPLRVIEDITIEAWVVLNEKESTSAIFSKMNSAVTYPEPYYLGLSSGKPFLAMGNGTTEVKVISSTAIPVGSPSHIVATVFRKSLCLYINGLEVATQALGSQEVKDSKQPVFIGALSDNSKRFNGLISEVAIYSGGISPKEIERHYKIGRQIVKNTSHVITFDQPSYS